MLSVAIFTSIAAYEIISSFHRKPFQADIQCGKLKPLEQDGWTSGRYRILDVPAGTHGLTLNLLTTQPNVNKQPLSGIFNLSFNERTVSEVRFSLNETGPQKLSFEFPQDVRATPDDYQIDLRLSRCFVPKNFGMGSDARRLGIRIDSIDWWY